MENLYVSFKIEVGIEEHAYRGQSGEAEMKIQVPRSMLENLDPSPLFGGVLLAALANFDAKDEEEKAG